MESNEPKQEIKIDLMGASHVRMSSSEYKQIKRDSEASGRSIGNILENRISVWTLDPLLSTHIFLRS